MQAPLSHDGGHSVPLKYTVNAYTGMPKKALGKTPATRGFQIQLYLGELEPPPKTELGENFEDLEDQSFENVSFSQ